MTEHSGTLGDLSKEQERVFTEWKTELKDHPKDKATDDFALLRFLRARKFELKAAKEMRDKHIEWRKKWDVDNILKTRPPKLDLVHKLLPNAHHGIDKEGRPVIFEKLGKVESNTMVGLMSADEYLRCHIYKMQTLIARAEESSAKLGKNIETFTMVMDLNGVRFDSKQSTKFLTLCSENDNWNYPERLGRLIVVNTPWVFPLVWKVVSPFIDAKTKAKISVVYSNPIEELTKFITADQIPKEYGGQCECKGAGKPCVTEFDLKELKLADLGVATGEDPEKINVGAGKKHEVKLNVPNKGGTLHWFFRVEGDYNISFSVDVIGTDKKKNVIKAPTKLIADQGSVAVPADATVLVTFDNSFSWMTGKTLKFSTVVLPAEDAALIHPPAQSESGPKDGDTPAHKDQKEQKDQKGSQ